MKVEKIKRLNTGRLQGMPFETRFSLLATAPLRLQAYTEGTEGSYRACGLTDPCLTPTRRAEIGEGQSPPSAPMKKAEIGYRRFPPYFPKPQQPRTLPPMPLKVWSFAIPSGSATMKTFRGGTTAPTHPHCQHWRQTRNPSVLTLICVEKAPCTNPARRAEIGESQSPPSAPMKKAEIGYRRFPPYVSQ